jgi:L-2-hydroxycarboxylate dehydrogenase (NAD+)
MDLRPEPIVLDASELGASIMRILGATGASALEASRQTSMLLEAELRGRPSHGLQRLPTIIERVRRGLLEPGALIQIDQPAAGVLVVDGGFGFGPHVAFEAIDRLSALARTTGIALGVIKHTSHVGMLAPYLEAITSRRMIGLMFTTSEALVHPQGGTTALVGTNPIGIGIPTDGEPPVILDMATSAISAGEIISHAGRGIALLPGQAIGGDGYPTIDPLQAQQGAISPFGGGKGFALGLAIELLVAMTTDTALGTDVLGTLDAEHPVTKGDVLIVIDIETLGLAHTLPRVSAYLEALRASPPAPGTPGVLLPGDRSASERARRLTDGVAIPTELWSTIERLDPQSTIAGGDPNRV